MKNKSDLLPDTIKVKVGKDGAPLTPPETLTVKIDYSRREFTADSWMYDAPDKTGKCNTESFDMDADSFYDVYDGGAHYNAQKLAASVMPVFSTLPFRVEFLVVGKPYWVPAFFKLNPFVKRLGIPSPAAFVSPIHFDSIAPKIYNMAGKKVLPLTVSKEWFDKIVSGEKTEEYREIKPYWIERLTTNCEVAYDVAAETYCCGMVYTHVLFINGYRKDSPRIEKEIESITIGKPKKGMCPDKWLDTEFFIIKFK